MVGRTGMVTLSFVMRCVNTAQCLVGVVVFVVLVVDDIC
jgi:hypothetical protein